MRSVGAGGEPGRDRFPAAPEGLVMVGLDGPAPVCADGVCAVPDDEPTAAAGTPASTSR